jgi:hypothetical protein
VDGDGEVGALGAIVLETDAAGGGPQATTTTVAKIVSRCRSLVTGDPQ